jgi:hypothetical protein
MEASFLRNSSRIVPKCLKGSNACDVSDATHTQEDGVEGSEGYLNNVAEVLALFLCGLRLVLRSSAVQLVLRSRHCFFAAYSWL